jgi:hypothetical protein
MSYEDRDTHGMSMGQTSGGPDARRGPGTELMGAEAPIGDDHLSSAPRRRTSTVLTAAIAGCGLALAASAEPYALVDLGVDVSPEDVNALRVVVGSRQLAPDMTTAFVYSPADGSLRDLDGTIARAVNDSGVIVGDTATGAFLFDGSSTLDLPDSSARGINESALTTGAACAAHRSAELRAACPLRRGFPRAADGKRGRGIRPA